MKPPMQSTNVWLLGLTLGAAFLNGFLTGGNVDRLLVATPAWNHLGLDAWADFSRNADLGSGQIVYPLMALGSTALAVLAAAIYFWKARCLRGLLLPIGLSAAFMVVALPFSLRAIPYMTSLRHIQDADAVALGRAFAGAHLWGRFQSCFHIAAFCAQLWSIFALGVHWHIGKTAALDRSSL